MFLSLSVQKGNENVFPEIVPMDTWKAPLTNRGEDI